MNGGDRGDGGKRDGECTRHSAIKASLSEIQLNKRAEDDPFGVDESWT